MSNPDPNLPKSTPSPFGGDAKLLQTVPVKFVVEEYKKKCGIDVSPQFSTLSHIGLYECATTDYKFWRPEEVAGDQAFYHDISHSWSHYYREERWEYPHVRASLADAAHVLEIGCGKGYFLRSIESIVKSTTGLELNEEAIRNKVTTADVLNAPVEVISALGKKFDFVCAFHVLEHVINPDSFITHALACLKDEGTLVLSTPNNDSAVFRSQRDIFDFPPHHMGHFTSNIYKKIARKHNCTVTKIVTQPRRNFRPNPRTGNGNNMFQQAARIVMSTLAAVSYRPNRGPGETLLVFLKKRPHT